MSGTPQPSVAPARRSGLHVYGVLVDASSVLAFLADPSAWSSQAVCEVVGTSDREVAELLVSRAGNEVVGHVRVVGCSRERLRVDYELVTAGTDTASVTVQVSRHGPRTLGRFDVQAEGQPAQLARGLVAVLAVRFPPELSSGIGLIPDPRGQLWHRALRPRVERLARGIGRR